MAGPRYAVVLKVYFWDAFIDRQFHRLARHCGGGDLFVLADETKGPVHGINHDRVIRMTEETARQDGFLAEPPGHVFWYNCDYQLYHFTRAHPDYEYIVLVEHDCVVNVDIAPMIAAMAAERLDFIGHPMPDADWYWKPTTAPFYPPDMAITGRLPCFAAFSRDFALDLETARREHAGRVTLEKAARGDAYKFSWPNVEAIIGCELTRRGGRERPLADFGDVSHYNWAPAMPEAVLPQLDHCGFIHPILDTARFLLALSKINQTVDSIFDPNSHLSQIAAQVDPAPLLAEILRHFIRRRDLAAIARLRALADARGARQACNVARGKSATQSSLSEHSRGGAAEEDAAGAVDGTVTGRHGFHTDHDEQPWWSVDLRDVCPVREIRVFNRLDLAERARDLVVMASVDMAHWAVLHENTEVFGGADGRPLRIEFPEPVAIRFLRLSLPRREYLHLDEVEVYV